MATAKTTTTGKHAQTTPTTGRSAHTIELSPEASYALAKQVPDVYASGCTISTDYGDITIPPGRLAERLASLLSIEISRGGLQ